MSDYGLFINGAINVCNVKYIRDGYTVKSQVWKATGSCKCCRPFLARDLVVRYGKQKSKRFKVEWEDITSHC